MRRFHVTMLWWYAVLAYDIAAAFYPSQPWLNPHRAQEPVTSSEGEMIQNGLIGLALVFAVQSQINSIAIAAKTADAWDPDRYPSAADDLGNKLVRVVAAPNGQVMARDVERELSVKLIKTQPSTPQQGPFPFYEVKAGKNWYFDVVVNEAHAPYGAVFTFAYPNLIRSSAFCINLARLTKGLQAEGYSPSETKVLEPENLELTFYKQNIEIHVGYDRAGCMNFLTMTAPPSEDRVGS